MALSLIPSDFAELLKIWPVRSVLCRTLLAPDPINPGTKFDFSDLKPTKP
jgi:hypothetical protein